MPTEVNSDTFEDEILNAEKPVLIDFWGPQCVPCLALMPHLEIIENKYGDNLKVVKIDASKNKRLCLSLRINGLPTFLLYESGKEIDRITGQNVTSTQIDNMVKKNMRIDRRD